MKASPVLAVAHALALPGALLCALLGACATPKVPPLPPSYFHDALFSAPRAAVGADDLFALNPEMRAYLDKEVRQRYRRDGEIEGLIAALRERGQLRLDYDAALTRNAAQAFADRRGNCLSLVVMTAAFAKALGLRVGYQVVDAGETWSLKSGVAFLNTHVNLTLDRNRADVPRGYNTNRLYTVDFLPAKDAERLHSRAVSEDAIVAMYLNNRAAEALSRGELDDAYWWARAALQRAPDNPAAYNTLGVIYLDHGNPEAARAVLEAVLATAPDDTLALSNLALVYERMDLAGQALALRERLARLEPEPPFHYFLQGTAAMQRGDYVAARALFEREVQRADYNGQFHFWLGMADLKLGDLPAARRHIALAVEYSTSPGEQAVYAGKLERLRAGGVH